MIIPLFLSTYEYTSSICCTKAHVYTDTLSMLPLPVEPATIGTLPEHVLLTEYLNNSPILQKLSVYEQEYL